MANPSELYAVPPSPNGATSTSPPNGAPSAIPTGLDGLFEEFLRLVRAGGGISGGGPPGLREWVDLAEAWRITQALRECRGNRSAAARSLGIGRRTLYSKMEKLGIAEGWTFPNP